MGHYRLDDPALQLRLDELADRDTADWPEPSTEDRAQLTRLLPAPQRRPAQPASPAPKRRAA